MLRVEGFRVECVGFEQSILSIQACLVGILLDTASMTDLRTHRDASKTRITSVHPEDQNPAMREGNLPTVITTHDHFQEYGPAGICDPSFARAQWQTDYLGVSEN